MPGWMRVPRPTIWLSERSDLRGSKAHHAVDGWYVIALRQKHGVGEQRGFTAAEALQDGLAVRTASIHVLCGETVATTECRELSEQEISGRNTRVFRLGYSSAMIRAIYLQVGFQSVPEVIGAIVPATVLTSSRSISSGTVFTVMGLGSPCLIRSSRVISKATFS